MAPVVSDEFLYKTIVKKIMTFDATKDVNPEYLPSLEAMISADYNISKNFVLSGEINYLFVKQGQNSQPADFTVFKALVNYVF